MTQGGRNAEHNAGRDDHERILTGDTRHLDHAGGAAFRQQVGAEIEEMKAQGIVPEIPYDFD